MFNIVLEIIKENIVLVKDFFTIFFYGVATVIAILTFNRAKETFLQPVRSEVIKKQTELLTELLQFLYKNKRHGDGLLDYLGLVRVNIVKSLSEYGFIFQVSKEVRKEVDAQVVGFLYCGSSNQIEDIEIIPAFQKEDENDQDKKLILKERYEKAKKGDVIIDKIFLTKKHNEYVDKLTEYFNDPFLPLEIKNKLDRLLADIRKNLTCHLKNTIKSFMKRVFEKGLSRFRFSADGIYNEFNHIRIHHNQDYDDIVKEVRKYLKIDSMPS